MTIQTAFTYITGAISELYEERESANIAHIVMEHLTGMSKLDRIVHKTKILSPDQRQRLGDREMRRMRLRLFLGVKLGLKRLAFLLRQP